MKNILFIAPPAAGKGTQSDLLVQKYGYVHISTGDLLRNIDPQSDLGKEVNELIKMGKLVDDRIVLELLKEKLLSLKSSEHFILDGFPRNLTQAKELEELLSKLNMSLDLVISLNVPYDIALKRALGRLNCPNCKATYNKFFKPSKVKDICDVCGSALVSRTDDNPETFKVRYDAYLESTMPLIDYYKNAGKLVEVDGVNNTFEKIVSVINDD